MTMQSIIRRQIIAKRKSLDLSYIQRYQPQFDSQILAFIEPFSSIGIYSAVCNEISVDIVMGYSDEKKLALPKINGLNELEFVHYENPNLWRKGRYDILEPTTKVIDFIPEIILVPLTVIDKVGTRVGMGKGYYDRYLSEKLGGSLLVGVGWDFQLVDNVLVRQQHDIPMDYFISPSHLINFRQ